jgi:TonB-linked SusC/RagA family outer membrane protein
MRKVILTLLVAVAFMLNAKAQDRTITGKVTDDKGAAVSGVSVTSSDKTRGTQTDGSGSYSIVVGPFTKTLTFSSVNFESQTQNIRGSQINVRLASSSSTLEDVVVTGVKNVKRSEYPGATTRLRRADIENKPVGSFDQLLQGAVPGLLSLTSSGQPGTSASIIIRGSGSISGGTNPLYILDGMPIEQSTFQGLNPNDFATIDILKDATATALYGSRGSAGVIVITSKKGSAGKLKLSYSSQNGIKSKPDFAFSPMTTAQLLAAQEAYGKIAGGGSAIPGWYYSKSNPRYATLTPAQQASEAFSLDSISKINTNWKDYMFRNGAFSNNELSVSGGAGRTRFFSSVGLYKEAGVTPRTDMKRISFRNNVDYADDKLSVSFATAVAYTKRNFQQSTTTNGLGNPFLAVNITSPYSSVYKSDGVNYATGTGNGFAGANQLDLTRYDKNYSDQVKTDLNMTSSYKLTNTITLGATAGVDFRETQSSNYGSQLAYARLSSATPTGKAGFQTEGLTRFVSLDIRPSVNFDKIFAGKHKVNVGVYGEHIRELTKSFTATGFGIDPRIPNTPAAITQGNATNLLFSTVTGGKSQNALTSGLVLGSYTFNDKYSFSGSYRYDGSSKLPKSNRWTPFYSVGGIWTVTKENFMRNSKVVNELRLRASYGSAGNSNNFPFGDFGYLDTYGTGSYAGLSTLTVTNIGNPDLKWETIYQGNIGVDFSLLKNRIYGSVDVYNKTTKDLFVQKQLSAPGGYLSLLTVNAGELSNKGIEFDLSIDVLRKKDFVWTINGKAGYNKNKVTSLGGLTSYPSGTSLVSEGLALNSPYEVRWGGVDAATGQPLYYTKDGVLTTTYSASDKVQTYGTSEAPWKGGFSNSIRYKSFDFTVFFTWQHGAVKTDNLEYFTENPIGFLSGGFNQSASLNFWTKPGDLASTPSPLYATNFSSKIIHDASFIRLKDVTIAYTVPSDMLTRVKFISRMRFYAEAQNVFMWTKWRGMDPEAGAININLSEFPNPRAFTLGLDLTF